MTLLKHRYFKKSLKALLYLLFIIACLFTFQNFPISSQAKLLPRLSDTTNIKACLELITKTPKPRYFENIETLDTVAERIKTEFLRYTNKVEYQNFLINEYEFKNVIASFGPENAERIIIGAHYDVCEEQEGADDNASGVAGLLELARLLSKNTLNYRIDLVAYSLEEPPFFNTQNMGSFIHAKSLYDKKIPVFGMISLEMIGYYSNKEDSQEYPLSILKWFYGNKGDFITIVQETFCGEFSRKYKKLAFENNSIITKAFRAPSSLKATNLSDHKNYWHFEYSAVMITNTAFYRNKNYHKESDKVSTLDINRMALTIESVYRTLLAF